MPDPEPRRRRGDRRREVDGDSARMQEAEDLVEPRELPRGVGSISAQLKTPTVTRLTPARCMRAMSSRQTSGDHCSGL